MQKTFKLFLVLNFFICFSISAQEDFSMPKNPEAGKCYQRCFTYDKPFKWEEVDCKTELAERKREKTSEEVVKAERAKIKLEEYQEKLIALGYDVNVTGLPDNKTINAHHKYLKVKKKQKRKEKKRKKKKE